MEIILKIIQIVISVIAFFKRSDKTNKSEGKK